MTDAEKFEGFKQELLAENEQRYGDEVRERWGAQSYEQAQQKVVNMTEAQWAEVEDLSNRINERLKAAVLKGDPSGTDAREACDLHRQWLCHFWPDGMYTKAIHRNMGQMYCADPRFKAYYDAIASGAAEFLREAIEVYASE